MDDREGLLHAPERAPARSHLHAMGIDPARMAGPVVGIASTWTGTMPCNLAQRELARRVAAGVEAAGGVPLEFSGATRGLMVGHVAPESARGGPLALLRDGDPIVIDATARAR